MKNTKTMLMATVMMLGLAATAMAQPSERGGQSRMAKFMMAIPVMAALDRDQDGTISAQEIANASQALAKLDENGDGELSFDEIRPQRSEGGRGPGARGKGGAEGKGAGAKGKGGPGGKGKGGFGGRGKGGKGKGSSNKGGGQRPNRPAADDGDV